MGKAVDNNGLLAFANRLLSKMKTWTWLTNKFAEVDKEFVVNYAQGSPASGLVEAYSAGKIIWCNIDNPNLPAGVTMNRVRLPLTEQYGSNYIFSGTLDPKIGVDIYNLRVEYSANLGQWRALTWATIPTKEATQAEIDALFDGGGGGGSGSGH